METWKVKEIWKVKKAIRESLEKHGVSKGEGNVERDEAIDKRMRCPECNASVWWILPYQGNMALFCAECGYTVPIVPLGEVSHGKMRIKNAEERIERLENEILVNEDTTD